MSTHHTILLVCPRTRIESWPEVLAERGYSVQLKGTAEKEQFADLDAVVYHSGTIVEADAAITFTCRPGHRHASQTPFAGKYAILIDYHGRTQSMLEKNLSLANRIVDALEQVGIVRAPTVDAFRKMTQQ